MSIDRKVSWSIVKFNYSLLHSFYSAGYDIYVKLVTFNVVVGVVLTLDV